MVTLGGCGGQKSDPPVQDAKPKPEALPALAPSPNAAGSASGTDPQGAALPVSAGTPAGKKDEHGRDAGLVALNEAVKAFLEDGGRLPRNWTELLESGRITVIPTPPPGKRYYLDPQLNRVTLVDQ